MKYRFGIIFTLLFFGLILTYVITTYSETMSTQGTNNRAYTTVIIDAGHGGEDGGAVGVDGVIEKDLNLPIALEVARLLKKDNIDVILTRDGDYAIPSKEAKTLHERKASDIHNRFAIIEDTENCIFVSIHMNHYDSPSCTGAQTFYSDNNEESEVLAQTIQSHIKKDLQPANERRIKPATSSIYLLYYARVPAVLVECGFISNAEESKQLQDSTYQKEMASSISNAILDYLGKDSQNIESKKSESESKAVSKKSAEKIIDKSTKQTTEKRGSSNGE